MDEIIQTPENTKPVESSIGESPKKRGPLRKVFNITSWIVLFALLPITVLIFLSQDSIPGDFFYPVKRSMENVILAAASVSPATRAAFRTDLTQARFKEAQSLVISQSNTSGLAMFIDDVRSTQLEVTDLKDDTQRIKAEEKLISKLEEYQTGLSTLEAKTEQTIITYQSQEIPTPTPIPPSFAPNLPSLTPTLVPTSTPTPLSSFKSQPTLTLSPVPTLTLAPTIAPTLPPQQENAQITEQRRIAITIKETKEQLDTIKKDLEENRRENKENREKRNESEKKDSSDRHKNDD